MNVKYTDETKQPGEALGLLQQATQRLAEVLGSSAEVVNAEWDRGQDERGRPLYTLRLSDFTGAVSARFDPDELRSPNLRGRFLGLWGDLLQIRSDHQVKKLQQLVREGSDGGEADSR